MIGDSHGTTFPLEKFKELFDNICDFLVNSQICLSKYLSPVKLSNEDLKEILS